MRLAAKTLPEQYPHDFFLQLARLGSPHFRVAKAASSGRLVGFIVGVKQPALAGNVLLLAVDPDAQGQGLGRMLLRDLQRSMTLDDVRELSLEVRTDNFRAIQFYERQGFAVTGLQERVYRDGSDALWMSKALV